MKTLALPVLCALGALGLAAAEPPLSLDDCLALANSRHPALAASQAGVAAATEAVGEARAPYLPQVDLSAGYHRWQKRAFLPSGLSLPGRTIPDLIGPLNDWTGGVTGRYTLYDFGERGANVSAAIARRAAAEAEADTTRADVRWSVQTAFFGLAAAQELATVADQNLARTERHLRMVEARRQAGAVSPADVLRLEAEVAAARLQVISAQSQVRVAGGRLNTMMGRAAETPVAITPPTVAPPPPQEDLGQAVEHALARRPELQSAAKRVTAAKAGVEGARASRAAKVRADAAYGWNDTAWTPETREWQAGLSVDVPVFDGGTRRSRISRSRAELAREEANLENRRLQVRQEVWAAMSEVDRTWASIAANEAGVKASSESLRVTQERYQNGAAVVTDLLDTQTALTRAEAGLAAARWDYLAARAAYDRATGATSP
ncbi:MAG: TolC family protein [Verrucomicrobia bacterium]|nr:TolC family protein [Verrucomicrobiota bacterium]